MNRSLLALLLFLIIGNQAFNQQIPTDSLILYFPFNGNAADESSTNYDGMLYGVTNSNDRFLQSNSAYTFDGINDYIELSDDSNLKPDFPFAISLWFTVDELSDITSILYASDEVLGIYSGFYIGYNSAGSISAGYCDGQGYGPYHRRTKHSDIFIETDEWYQLIVSFNDLNDIDIYLNCEEESGYYSGSASSLGNLDGNGIIGRSWGHNLNNYHNGKIDDIRLYNKSLTNDEITGLCMEAPCSGVDSITVYTYITVTDTLLIDVNILNLDDEEIVNTLKVYPNPTSDILYINTGNYASMNNYLIRITNSLGATVFGTYCNEDLYEIDMNIFGANGLYFIQLFDDFGNLIDTRQIVLQ